jgi:hypothetical protein
MAVNLATLVYERLKQDIFDFRMLPGDRFTESEISERTQASRTPVREALYRLEHDGYVEVMFRSGWRVKPFDFRQHAAHGVGPLGPLKVPFVLFQNDRGQCRVYVLRATAVRNPSGWKDVFGSEFNVQAVERDGFVFYRWPGADKQLIRLVTAYDTAAADVDGFVASALRHAG